MSSSTNATTDIQTFEDQREDTVRVIVQRLMFISSTEIFCWVVFVVFLHFMRFPVLQPNVEGQPIEGPDMLSVRLAANLLLTQFVSQLFIQAFAARHIVRARMISNTMFGGLVLSLCVAITVAANLIPPNAIPYLKQAIAIAYNPAFVIANFLLCSLSGFLLYRFREVRFACMVELYWSLGLMFLLGLAIALLAAIAQA